MLQVEITYRVAWRRGAQFCDNTTISSNSLVSGEGRIDCNNGCSGTVIPLLSFFCTSFSVAEDFTVGGRTVSFDFTTIKTADEITIGYTGCCWISPFNNWSLLTRFSVARRSDTGKVNSTPRTNAAPTIRIQEGCNQTIAIDVSDPDDDTVRCRWAIGSECSTVCNALPGAILNQNTCTIFSIMPIKELASKLLLLFLKTLHLDLHNRSVVLACSSWFLSSVLQLHAWKPQFKLPPFHQHPSLKVRRFQERQ